MEQHDALRTRGNDELCRSSLDERGFGALTAVESQRDFNRKKRDDERPRGGRLELKDCISTIFFTSLYVGVDEQAGFQMVLHEVCDDAWRGSRLCELLYRGKDLLV